MLKGFGVVVESFNKGCSWKNNYGLFDMTMGAYNGTEVCKLAGPFLLHKMIEICKRASFYIMTMGCQYLKTKKTLNRVFPSRGGTGGILHYLQKLACFSSPRA